MLRFGQALKWERDLAMNANIKENNLKQLGQPNPIQTKKKIKKKYKDPTRDAIVQPDIRINYASIPDP